MNILLIGKGRVGQELIPLIKQDESLNLVDILSKEHPIYNERESIDGIIDFSSPSSLENMLYLASNYNSYLVIGTTGYNKTQSEKIKEASKKLKIALDSNYSFVFHMLSILVNKIDVFPFEKEKYIIETHQKNKKDLPSGSSLILTKDKETIFSLRGGRNSGEHEVRYLFENEELSITHRTYNRRMYAIGALLMLKYLCHVDKGLYSMKDLMKGYENESLHSGKKKYSLSN